MIPTRYGQRLPCGVFVGIIKDSNSARAVYIPTIEYEDDREFELIDWLQTATETTSRTNGKLNTALIDAPSFNLVAESKINGYSDWYVPSVHEVCMIYHLANNTPMRSRPFFDIENSGTCFYVHTSTVIRKYNVYEVEQVYMHSCSIRSFRSSIGATMIPMRSDTIARKL